MNKKIMFVLFALFTLMATIAGAMAVAEAEECVDCCDGGVCGAEDANTPVLDLYDCELEVNGDEIYPDDVGAEVIERGEELKIKVRLMSNQDMEDVQVTAMLTGYHRDERLIDMTDTFDLEENDRESLYLTLDVPEDWDIQAGEDDIVNLRILISDDSHDTFSRIYKLRFEPKRDSVIIKDIILDPFSKVEAGRGLFASVRLKNMGENDEEGIKVTTTIPELGLKAREYVDELEEDESTTSEDMFLRIPVCTEAGEYQVKATVEYADGDESTSETTTIEILSNPECDLVSDDDVTSEKTVITVPGEQDVVKGTTGTVYPIIIQNKGVSDKAYELSAQGLDSWATYRFDPGTMMLIKSGQTKTAYLYVTPKDDAQVGEKVVMVSVKTSEDEEQIALSANVVEGEGQTDSDGNLLTGNIIAGEGSLKRAMEVGLIVLVVLLVVLGLIVGFNKMQKGEGGETDDLGGQTYY